MTTQKVHIIFMPSGRRGTVRTGQTVLEAARDLGIHIDSICGGRLTCGKCRIQVAEGEFPKHGITSTAEHLTPATDNEQALLIRTRHDTYRLACTACITGDLLITIPDTYQQVIRKMATDRAIMVNPALRQVYVEVEPATLSDHRSDWQRLQAALQNDWQLENLTIDLPALRSLQIALRQGRWTLTVTVRHSQEVVEVRPGYNEGLYGLAIDIGSTTLAAHLCHLNTGELLTTQATMNPQVSYGEDLMSRITYTILQADGLTTLHQVLIEAVNNLAWLTTKQVNLKPRNIHEVVIVGNPIMTYTLLNIDPVELGNAPFALAHKGAIDVKARDLGLQLHAGAYVHVLPAEAGHVGADNVAVLLAEEPHHRQEWGLIMDIGTNAELVLAHGPQMFSASSPTGPAFEGAQIAFGMRAAPGAIERVRIDPTTQVARFQAIGNAQWSNTWQETSLQHAIGICGSGIIEAVVEMYLAGIISQDGRMTLAEDHPRFTYYDQQKAYILATADQTATGTPIIITQHDVRSIQLGKAALYAGAQLLLNRAGVDAVDYIVLAGAFGSYIDPIYALQLGMLPPCDVEKIQTVGNAAGDGARIALLNHEKRREAQHLAQQVQYIELAADTEFQAVFVEALALP